MRKRVAVIGAGPMGLAVAYQLASDGYVPVIFEADDRIGGMAASFEFGGTYIERYYHFHCTSDTAFFDMLDELELTDKLHWRSTKMGFWYNGEVQPWGNPLALLRFRGLGALSKIRYGLHAYLATKRNRWEDLEAIDALSWIKKSVGREAFEVLWEKLFYLKFYDYSEHLSAPWIWSRIRRIGRSRYNLFEEKLGYLEGGSKTLLEAMRRVIERKGGEIRLSAPVRRVETDRNGVKGILTEPGDFEAFDTVVSTVPLPIVAKIMPGLPSDVRQRFREKINIAGICLIARLRKPLTENFWLNVNDDKMDIPGIIEYGNLNPEAGHIVYIPYYMPHHHPKYRDSDEIFMQKAVGYFKTINPDIKDEDVVEMRVHRYRYAQPVCTPRYLETLPDAKLPIRGLWAADTSYYYPEDRGISESIGYGRALAKRVANDIGF